MNRNKLTVIASAALALASLAVAAEQKAKEPQKSAPEADTKHVLLTPADLQWGEAPAGLPAGAKLAVLEGDPTKKGPFTIRLQMPDGYKIMPHTHPTAEKVTVISGTGFLGMGAKFDEAAAKQMEPAPSRLCLPGCSILPSPKVKPLSRSAAKARSKSSM